MPCKFWKEWKHQQLLYSMWYEFCAPFYLGAYMAMEGNLSHAGNMKQVDFFQVVCRIYEIQLRESQVDLWDGEGIWH